MFGVGGYHGGQFLYFAFLHGSVQLLHYFFGGAGGLEAGVGGAFAGALKKKLGLTIVSDKPQGGERVYRIA